jgi:hypothetical protein
MPASRSKSPAPKRAGRDASLSLPQPLLQGTSAAPSGGGGGGGAGGWCAFVLVLALVAQLAMRLLASGAGLFVTALVALVLLNCFAVAVLAYGFRRVTREQPVCRVSVTAGPTALDEGGSGGSGGGAPVVWTVALAPPVASSATSAAQPPPAAAAREYVVCGDTWLLGGTVVLFKAWAVAWAGAEPRCVLDRLQGHFHDPAVAAVAAGQRQGAQLVHRLAPADSAPLHRLCAGLLRPWLLDTVQYTAVAPAREHAMAKGEVWDVVQNGLGGLVARPLGNQRSMLARAASAMRGVGMRAAAFVGR